jgi:hypothetical protein
VKTKCEELKIEFDGKINPSDLRYYLNMMEQKEFSIDHAKLQEYFPMNVVIEGTFKIYQVQPSHFSSSFLSSYLVYIEKAFAQLKIRRSF